MHKYRIATLFILFFLVLMGNSFAERKNILVLNYHHISPGFVDDFDTNTQKTLAQHIEFLRTHGYHFVSVEDLVRATKGGKELPPKPVLLTFDDAYISFYKFVFPLLKELKCPAMVAVVGTWIDKPPKNLIAPLMSWKQLQELSKSGLVEVSTPAKKVWISPV